MACDTLRMQFVFEYYGKEIIHYGYDQSGTTKDG